MFEINTFGFIKMQSFILKKKISLGSKLSDLGTFALAFEKSIVVIQISILKFVKVQHLMKLEPKPPYLGIFGLEFEKLFCHFLNQDAPFCQNTKVHVKPKTLSVGLNFPYLCTTRPKFKNNLPYLRSYLQLWYC